MDFSQIAILTVTAAFFGVIAKILKQPLLIGYLLAGLALSYLGFVQDADTFSGLGQVGVTLLLFLLGLDMNFSDIKTIGKTALVTGLGQIIFTSIFGFMIATLLGFTLIPSLYIAVALTFSSTIIMVKLLSEKKDLSSLYGRISVGFLLVQDFVAVIILMFLASVSEGSINTSNGLFYVLLKGIFLLLTIWFLSKKVLPKFFDMISSGSTELLFIVSIAWALGLSAFVDGPLGFTPEIGGFLAGIALSNLPEHLQISSRTKPLRDFFLTIFFLLLGTTLLVEGGITTSVFPATIFSLFVLIGNPLIVILILSFLRYKSRTSFLAGLTVAQISEFSLVLMAMGEKVGHLNKSDVSVVVLVGIITMTISTYLILGAEKVYKRLKKIVSVFERKNTNENFISGESKMKDHIILVGCDKTGWQIVKYLKKRNIPLIVVDFNPQVFAKLKQQSVTTVFGDITDEDIWNDLNISESRLIISTISNQTDNLAILENLIMQNKADIPTMFTTDSRKNATILYEKGASYVVVPDILAGEYIRQILRTYGTKGPKLKKAGHNHLKRMLFT